MVFVMAGCKCPFCQEKSSSDLQAGVAEVDITPPVGHRMAGYFDERLSTGTHDPLQAKAVVLRQGKEEVAMVFCDLVGVTLSVATNARAWASQITGIPVTNIVICATHTHTGPLFDDVRRDYFHQTAIAKFGKDPAETIHYPDFLIQRLTNVIALAQRDVKPVEMKAGTTEHKGLSFNRRYWMKNGKVRFNPGRLNPDIVKPAGPDDPTVGVMQFTRLGAKEPFAGITTFAVHSDTVGGTLYSSDYEYFLQQSLRKAYGPNYISAFGLGTCGDLNHIDVLHTDTLTNFGRAEFIGTNLAQAVEQAAPDLRPIKRPTLAVRSTKRPIALQDVTPEQLKEANAMKDKMGDPNTDFFAKVAAVKTLDLAKRGSFCPMEVQVIRLDADTAIVCLPCEIFVEYGLGIKKASPFKTTYVLTICNDRPSYVPTLKAFNEGSYEISNARVKPGAGEELTDMALKLLKELKPE